MAEIERRAIVEAIERFGGNKQKAAAALGISRSTLYEKLKAVGGGTPTLPARAVRFSDTVCPSTEHFAPGNGLKTP